MSSTEANKAAVRDCFENGSRGNFDAFREVVTPDYVVHPEEVRGPEEGSPRWSRATATLSPTSRSRSSTSSPRAITWRRGRRSAAGTRARSRASRPRAARWSSPTLTISRCRDGKIEEEWELADTVGLLRQIGALPELAEA